MESHTKPDHSTSSDTTDVVKLYQSLEKESVEIWLVGGWAVDALLGEQTRAHADIDIVIQQKDVPKLRELLKARGYKDVKQDDTSPWNFVLGDSYGHEVDVHAVVFDENGNGIYGPAEKGIMFHAASLTGKGTINGVAVKCISAEYMVQFISPWLYKLHDKDFNDVAALCKRFKIELPKEYAEGLKRKT